jgi:hypothetical protein
MQVDSPELEHKVAELENKVRQLEIAALVTLIIGLLPENWTIQNEKVLLR